MDNKEAIKYLIPPIATSTEPSAEYLKQKEAYDLAIKALERPKGKWKLSAISEIGKDWYKCSVCGREIHTIEKMLKEYPFCHCGADMRNGVKNSETN